MKEFRFNRTQPVQKVNTSNDVTKPDTPTRDLHRRECEFDPGYNWRTDPYYSEDAIRERMKAAKAEKQPVNVNDKREHPNAENKSTENNW